MQDNTDSESINKNRQWLLIKGGGTKIKKIALLTVGIIGVIVLSGVSYIGYAYTSTPSHLRSPEFEHLHLRTQIIVDGSPVDFSHAEFQEEYDKNSCSAELSGHPVDFHDNVDQMTHVHWRGITGGELLKYYGWNLIGGDDTALGKRYDQGILKPSTVEIAGNLLPEVSEEAKFYVYTGDEEGYEQKDWNEFLENNLEEFFGKKSLLNQDNETSLSPLDWFSQKAYAHDGGTDDEEEASVDTEDKETLERINNMIGNVVIFAQENEPTQDEVTERFKNLVPLHNSVCGG